MGSPNVTIVRESRAQASGRIVGCFVFVACTLLVAPHVQLVRRIEVLAAGGFFGVLSMRYVFTLVRPGYLRISPKGIEQDLGWRKRSWSWDQVQDFRLVRTVPLVSVVLLRIQGQRFPTRLFGWALSPVEIERVLNHMKPEMAVAGSLTH